jgi:glycosyltransferase involved in cell wall biosynthesis
VTSQFRRVSLCTVTGDRAALLPLLEECVLAQDVPLEWLEWVVVDHSQAPLPPLFERARRAGVVVRHVRLERRLPLGAMRNRAHELCRGEFIVLLDDDDYYPPSRVRHAVESLQTSGRPVAGSSRLPILLLPERSLWLAGPYGDGHATANTLAFRRSFLADHRCQDDARSAEEAALLDHFQAPMVQLDPFQTICCIGHGGNTVDKRGYVADQRGSGVEPLRLPVERLLPADWLDRFEAALAGGQAAGASAGEAPTPVDPAPTGPRLAVITPYHREDEAVLRRCHRSVRAQTVPCTHFLVADGSGPAPADFEGRHISLGCGHGDNGNTPRAVGALCAMNEGFEAIAFLDADNWYHPNHLQTVLETRAREAAEVVFSDREVVFPDGTVLVEPDGEDRERSHVDTSCIVVFAPAFHSLALWAQMPAELGPQCDRVSFAYLRARCLCAWSGRASVGFETWYLGHFVTAGLRPPATAKFLARRPAADWEAVRARFRQRSPTPVSIESLPESAPRAQMQVLTILAPPASGGTALQLQLCRQLGFFGLPTHNLLHAWAQAIDRDPGRRHDGSVIQAALEALERDDGEDQRWESHSAVAITSLLDAGRSFSLLEAYFRVVQRSAPARAHRFSRAFGPITLVDRSPTQAQHADLLYAMLPSHQAVLLLQDPLRQLARLRQRSAGAAAGRRPGPLSLAEHCAQILAAWLTPLRAAPPGQLLVLRAEALERAPEEGPARVWAFLGLPQADRPGVLERREPPGGVCNPAYEREQARLDRLSLAEISSGSPWLADEAQEAQGAEWPAGGDGSLTETERQAVLTLFAPLAGLGTAWGWNEGAVARRPDETLEEGLAALAQQVADLVTQLERRRAEAPAVPHLLDEATTSS